MDEMDLIGTEELKEKLDQGQLQARYVLGGVGIPRQAHLRIAAR
jgi:hypothetical protein